MNSFSLARLFAKHELSACSLEGSVLVRGILGSAGHTPTQRMVEIQSSSPIGKMVRCPLRATGQGKNKEQPSVRTLSQHHLGHWESALPSVGVNFKSCWGQTLKRHALQLRERSGTEKCPSSYFWIRDKSERNNSTWGRYGTCSELFSKPSVVEHNARTRCSARISREIGWYFLKVMPRSH